MDAKQKQRIASDPAFFQSVLVIPSVHGPKRFGDCMGEFQRERFAGINPALIALAQCKKPPIGKHWWEATKGASKDSDLAVCMLWLLAFTSRPIHCQVGAADRDQAGELLKAAKDVLYLNPWLAQRVRIQNWKIQCAATESVSEIIAADIAGSHGARPDVLILNELSHVEKQEFAENMMDNASKVPRGLVVVATNAGFTGTWQFKWRELARTSDRWLFHRIAKPSPWLDEEEIEEARIRNSTSRYNRLWHGVWASGAGDALDSDDIQAAIDNDLVRMTSADRQYSYVAGLDLGIKNDHSALVVLGVDPRTQRVRLADCQSWAPGVAGQVDLETVEAAVLDAHKRFQFSVCGYDPFQCALMAQRLQKALVPMHEVCFNGKNLDKMASAVLDVFRSRRIDLYSDERLVADLSRLSIVEKSYGYKLESVRDVDGHADRATALAIGLILMDQARPALGPWGGVIDTRRLRRGSRWHTNSARVGWAR